jgi:magnesium chelatase family protein
VGFARTYAATVAGVQGTVVEVEAHLSAGLPAFTLVGLPDTALVEARDRVRAAVVNSGEPWPAHRVTVSLSPAWLPKRGSSFDLALAVVVLAAAGTIPADALGNVALLGELGLDGRVRRVRGILPSVLAAARERLERVVVPAQNTSEARLVPGVAVRGVVSLAQLLAELRGTAPADEEKRDDDQEANAAPPADAGAADGAATLDLADVLGQDEPRRALEVSAAGGHHLYLHGPPGAGKTMLAERLPGLLPDLDDEAALEVTSIHSVAGTLPANRPLLTRPPYSAPHHTASVAAVVGGGSGLPRPGAVSLAHRGVLFLDEAPEFQSGVLDALRQPLESGEITVSRAAGAVRFPARFTLVLAANPCPCARPAAECSCTPQARRRYIGRLSGPILDRIDIRAELYPVTRRQLAADTPAAESTGCVAARVHAARERARARLADTPWSTNAEVPGSALRSLFRPPRSALEPLDTALGTGLLTARGIDRVLRLAWTVADLGARSVPAAADVTQAITLRTGLSTGTRAA